MKIVTNAGILLARICISALFLWAALAKFFNWGGTIEYIGTRLPFPTYFLLIGAVVQLVGGLSVLSGFKTRWGATLLILFIIPAMFIFHNFWESMGTQRIIEKTFFMKDLAVFGGLLLLTIIGGGEYSLDRYLPLEVRRKPK